MANKKSLSALFLLCALVLPWLFVRTRRDTPTGAVDLNGEAQAGNEDAVPDLEEGESSDSLESTGTSRPTADGHRHDTDQVDSKKVDPKTSNSEADPSLLEVKERPLADDLQKKTINEKKMVDGETHKHLSQISEETKWGPTFEALGKDHHGKVPVQDYLAFQAGSFAESVQEKFKELASEFATEGSLDLKSFVQVKAAEEKHEKVLALTMFQSFDHDQDGLITVSDLTQWTKDDATQHNVELDPEQEKYFMDQYQSHADATGNLDFEAFVRTGLTKLVINSYLESPDGQETAEVAEQ